MKKDTEAREGIFSKVVDLQRALSRREFFQIALRVFEKAEKEVCFVRMEKFLIMEYMLFVKKDVGYITRLKDILNLY